MPTSLGELASRFGCELVGDPGIEVDNVATLNNANPRSLSFLSNSAYTGQLAETSAAAVVLRASDADAAPSACLISENPYATYARMAAAISPPPVYEAGIHSSAYVDPSATVAASAHVAANTFIGERTTIGDNVYVGAGSFIGPDCSIGDDVRLIANVTIVRSVRIGRRSIIHPGAVIGSDGFGNAMTPEGWVKVPQLGGVSIGDDVEVGANTAIDCGALDDTVIEDGVRIDNLVMIAHNVRIGAHTAIAAQSGIAGSTVVGRRCMFAGQVGVAGHLTICDDAVFSGQAMISRNITEPGRYASNFPAEPAAVWNRRVARFRRLDSLTERVSKLEKGSK